MVTGSKRLVWVSLLFTGLGLASFLGGLISLAQHPPTAIDAQSKITQTLTVTKNASFPLGITNVGQSLQGYWRTSGIKLVIDSTNQSSYLEGLQNSLWGDTLTFWCQSYNSCSNFAPSPINVSGLLKMPQVAGPDAQDIKAHITGDITFPVQVGQDQFDNKTTTIYIELNLHLIPPAEYNVKTALYNVIGYGPFILMIVFAITSVVLLYVWYRRQPKNVNTTQRQRLR